MVDGRFLFLLTCICINCRFGDHQCSIVACEERLRVAHVAPATTNVPCGLWGTPSGGPRRSGDHQCSIWPVRSAFGWSVLHLRSLKGAVSTEGKHPWCMGKSAHLWEQMSLRFYVMMKAFRIPFRYFYFFSADRHKNAFKICVLRYFLTFRMSFLWLCVRHKTIWNLVACVCMWSLKLCGVTCVRPKGTPSDAAAICPEGSIT